MQHHKRKKADHDSRRAGSHQADSSVKSHSPSPALGQSSRRYANQDGISAEGKTTTTSPDDDEIHHCESGDLLNGVGSASSLSSTVSSVFSSNQNTMSSYPGPTNSLHALTPLTNTDSSPPGKTLSPRSAKLPDDTMHGATASPYIASSTDLPQNATEAMTPVHTPPEDRKQARPGSGEDKGEKIVYDPMLDEKEREKAEIGRPVTLTRFALQDDPSPPPDPRLAIAGYTTGSYGIKTVNAVPSKVKLRMAPLAWRPYAFDPRISVGPGPATQVVVTGFDPLLPESQIKAFFGGYGEVAEVSNKTDPNTGSFLGICLVKYKDSKPVVRGMAPIKASDAAKRAEKEGTNQRIGLRTVRVQLDREGRKCQRLITAALDRNHKEQDKLMAADHSKKSVTPVNGLTPTATTFDLPPNVPKGPSGKGGMRPPEGPRLASLPKPAAHALVEKEPIIDKIKRKPYIFIAHQYVPVLGTTISHLQKRLKNYHWKEVRVDPSGYFIIFEDSKRGEDETTRCFKECHMTALFTYVMNMECQQYGNPNYERSPSPERVLAEKREQEERERLIREEAMDLEYEKKRRAEDLDPVIAALEQLKTELRDRVISDIKARIAGPALFDYLDPDRHVAKRRKLNIEDPQSKAAVRPTPFFGRGDDTPSVGTPDSRTAGFSGRFRKALGPHDHNIPRARRMPKIVNAFQDERRSRKLPHKRPVVRGLHRQMLDFYDEDKDSDDEGRSSFTRDTEEQESRPLSRAASTDIEDEETSMMRPPGKRRRLDAGWGEESDDEMVMDDSHARSLLSHLIDKDPEDMAEKELEQVLAILPRSSPIWKKADRALKGARKLRRTFEEADALFFGINHDTTPSDQKEVPLVDITLEDDEAAKPVATTELEAEVKAEAKKKPRTKRKTKTQIFQEREALKEAQTKAASEEVVPREEETPAVEEPKVDAEIIEQPVEYQRAEVEWGVSADKPRRTVEDDPEIVLDIDGWQHMLKDNEDLQFLREALAAEPASNVGDVYLWAWKQKQIKALNRPGEQGVVRSETKIEGYYVPNSTGCARTEGVKKILEAEKSKYLPHRIRVQKAREEREARVKNDPAADVQAAKLAAAAKMASTTSSRSNRANNRRLVNDINTQKQTMSAEGDAMRFNQLKKRKKLVKFDRSAIHNWGLYAEEDIAVNDMIIEYVGEKVRQRVADLREKKYDLQGVGSSYLFRIDEDTVIDATKMGGIARFINHSCVPNCTAKIIRVDGTKRIVIYALRDIAKNEELTYDYKFEREMDSTDRIPCLCGSVGCKGFLN
ncbi:histone H3-K4 methyltransferase Set1 [Lepidopterella palustris CBS 459.81]|uniref:Histone-lysine N-methyltransferase, H3 lysine-4 specific n=1 Tax=Lepidopterella palustris CBS 459.81 TaxID=1314670 RepID=A0A8E2E256_9PEZI|nr:histone H3-K4 methyltransferase Set1 [Lepidopterella palustris CBS 459.81]